MLPELAWSLLGRLQQEGVYRMSAKTVVQATAASNDAAQKKDLYEKKPQDCQD